MAEKHHITETPDTSYIKNIDVTHEASDVYIGGIAKFVLGLFVLIVVSFVLMWAMFRLLNSQTVPGEKPRSRVALTEKERLPPEPRLQLAPGFGVDGPDGRVNLELMAPASEYQELRREWDRKLEKGLTDPGTGVVIAMPIDIAKEKLLEENIKAKTGPDAENALMNSRMFFSDSSAGRVASEKRR